MVAIDTGRPSDRRQVVRVERAILHGFERAATLHEHASAIEYIPHFHGERNHQGLDNNLIDRLDRQPAGGPVRRRERLGGVLSDYTVRPRNNCVKATGPGSRT